MFGTDRIINRGDNPDLSVAFLLRNISDVTLRDINIKFEQTKTRRFSKVVRKENYQSVKIENINVKLFGNDGELKK